METFYTDFKIEIEDSFGDEVVFLSINANKHNQKVYFTITLYKFHQFLSQHFPEIGDYFKSVRKSIAGYGAKEKEVLTILQQEDFDFQTYFIKYIESHKNIVDVVVAQQIENQKNLQFQHQIVQKVVELEKLKPKNPFKTSLFLDNLEKAMLGYLIDNYPELAQGESQDFEKLQTILGEYVPKLGEKLIAHIVDLRNRKE